MANPQDIPSAVTELQEFNKESTALVITLQDLAQALRENAGAAAKFTGESAGAYKSMFSESITMASKMEGYTINQLKNRKSEAQFLKDLSKLEQDRARAQAKISYLEDKIATARIDEIPFIKKSLSILRDVENTLESQVDHANKLKGTFEKISKEVKVFDDLSDFFAEIPGVSKVFGEFQKAANAAREASAEGGDYFAAGAKELTGALTKGLAAFALSTIVKGLTNADERAVDLSRNLNKSADESFRLVRGFNAAARSIQGLTGAELQKGATILADSLGSTTVSSNSTAKELAGIVKTMGMSTEEAAKQAEFSQATGQDIAKAGNEMRGQIMLSNLRNKTSIKYQAIMKDVANTSNATKLLMQGQGVSITKAAIEAKKLGTTLEGISKIGASMLDFESSIANELEAELLTGGEINNERARALALKGDELGLAEEIKKSGVLTKFANADNVLQQEALAKAYGMSKDEMADMAVKAKALKEMGATDQKDLQKKYDKELTTIANLRAQGKEQAALNLEKKLSEKLGSEEIKRQLENQTLADKQAEAMSKLAEGMDAMLPVMKAIGAAFEFIGRNAQLLSRILIALFSMSMLKKITNFTSKTSDLGKTLKDAADGGSSVGDKAKDIAKSVGKKTGRTTLNQALDTTAKKTAQEATETAVEGGAKSGSFFGKMAKGAKGLLGKGKGLMGKVNPLNALKGGVGKFGGLALKGLGGLIGPIITSFFAYNDIADLIKNPIDDDGKQLSKKDLNTKVGQIAGGGLANIIGGILGSFIPIPGIGTLLGSLGGEYFFHLFEDLMPSFTEGLGGLITPLPMFKDKEKKLKEHAKGGIFTSAQAGIIGEAGPEAVIPLGALYAKFDQLITATSRMGTPLEGLYAKMEQLTAVASKPSISLTGIYTKMDQLIAATSNKPITKETKPETVNPLTGLYAKMDQLIAATNKPVTPISLAGIYAKMDQLIAATGKTEITIPLTSLYAKLDQLIAVTGKAEINIPLTGLYTKLDQLIAVSSTPATTISLTGLYEKIDQLIAATNNKPVVDETRPEINIPLTGLYAKIDQLVAAAKESVTVTGLDKISSMISSLGEQRSIKKVVDKTPETVEALRSVITPLSAWKDKNKEETKTAPVEEKQIIKPVQTLAAGVGNDTATSLTALYAKMDQLILATKENTAATKETTAAVQKIDINPNLYLGTNKLNETIGLNIHRI